MINYAKNKTKVFIILLLSNFIIFKIYVEELLLFSEENFSSNFGFKFFKVFFYLNLSALLNNN